MQAAEAREFMRVPWGDLTTEAQKHRDKLLSGRGYYYTIGGGRCRQLKIVYN
jgi:hypothetical protein